MVPDIDSVGHSVNPSLHSIELFCRKDQRRDERVGLILVDGRLNLSEPMVARFRPARIYLYTCFHFDYSRLVSIATAIFQTMTTPTPNHALQRTPGFGVQFPRAALVRPAQSRAVLPAMKPGTARAFALRRRAHSRAPGPESLSLGSLGDFPLSL